MRRALSIAVLVLVLALVPVSAHASWVRADAGDAGARAKTVDAVAAPSASVAGRTVTVSWSAPSSGAPPTGYTVKRYNNSGQQQTIGASCSGTISGLTCKERKVPTGTWKYTVTPELGNWRGPESNFSAAVTVGSAQLSFSSSTVTSFPTGVSGTIDNFVDGQSVSFRLDDPSSGQALSGSISPDPVPENGHADVSVTIPAGTSNGSHTIYAIGSDGDQASAAVTVNAPKVTSTAIAKSAGGDPDFIKQGGAYFVYANVSGAGNPPSGFATLKADVSAMTSGQTAVSLANGSYSVNGQSYNYRSAQLTANALLTAGSKSFALTLTDAGGTQTQTNGAVTVDNTAPSASDIQTTNVSGGTAGKPELGDAVVLSYSEPVDANSVLSGWTGASTNVVVRLVNGGGGDQLQFFNAANSTQLPLGTVNLGRTDYVSGATITFGATGTPSTMVRSGATVTVTLGSPSAATPTAGGTGTMIWTPSASATDRAGNAASTVARTETGAPADRDF